MYWQREYIREGATLPRGETYRVDLPKDGILGALLFRMSVAGVSGAFAQADKFRILDFIDKIEVIADGTTVIKSLSGQLVNALQFYDQGITNLDYWHSYATGTKWCHLLLNFGRNLFDPLYALDLGKFTNVELRVSNDATSSEFGEDISLSILGYYLRDITTPRVYGYFRTEEWRSWTTVADETKYLELPVEQKVRRVILQAIPDLDSNNVDETAMWNLADDIEFALKTGVYRVFKGGLDDLMWETAFAYGRELLASHYLYLDADYGRRSGVGYQLSAVGGAGSQDDAGAATIPTLESRRTGWTVKPETYEADSPINTIIRGICPECTAVFRFDIPDEPDNYLDVNANKTVKLDIHTRNASSAADGTFKVVLDRYIPY